MTDEVSKEDKFNEISEEQPLNKWNILITKLVLKFVKSIDAKDEHPWNIRPIYVIEEELNFDKSILVIFEHSKNVLLKDVLAKFIFNSMVLLAWSNFCSEELFFWIPLIITAVTVSLKLGWNILCEPVLLMFKKIEFWRLKIVDSFALNTCKKIKIKYMIK